MGEKISFRGPKIFHGQRSFLAGQEGIFLGLEGTAHQAGDDLLDLGEERGRLIGALLARGLMLQAGRPLFQSSV